MRHVSEATEAIEANNRKMGVTTPETSFILTPVRVNAGRHQSLPREVRQCPRCWGTAQGEALPFETPRTPPELDAPASKAPEGLGNSANQVPADCLEVERRTSLRLTQRSIAFGARSLGKHPLPATLFKTDKPAEKDQGY